MGSVGRVSSVVAGVLMWSPLTRRRKARCDDGFREGVWRDLSELDGLRAALSPAALEALDGFAAMAVRDANVSLGFTDVAVVDELVGHGLVVEDDLRWRFTRDGWSLVCAGAAG